MKYNLTYLILFFTFLSYSQTEFQKGYFIKNNSDKVDCLIKNEDWSNNPTNFSYKLNENTEVETANINEVKEFTIINISKFIKRKVDVDISSNNINNLNYLKEPEWESRTVFLKVLLEGDSSLFFYTSPGLNRYFYNVGEGEIIQLVYKRYNIAHQKIKSNNYFRQQLLNSFSNCTTLGEIDFKNVKYNASSLAKLIKSYNSCQNTETISYSGKGDGVKFNLKIKGGFHNSTINNVTHALTPSRNVSFGSVLGYRFAIEGEVVLPFNNDKWGLFVEFAKNQKLSKEAEAQGGRAILSYDYFEGMLGVRHYLYFNERSKVSFHLGYLWDLSSDLKLDYDFTSFVVEGERTSGSFFFGAGFHFDKISIEARLNIKKRAFEGNTALYKSDFNSLNVTLGYTLL